MKGINNRGLNSETHKLSTLTYKTIGSDIKRTESYITVTLLVSEFSVFVGDQNLLGPVVFHSN